MAISWTLAAAIFVVFIIGYLMGYGSGRTRGRLEVLEEEHVENEAPPEVKHG